MVERSRRGKGKLLGSHQKCWIWGRHVVAETLRAGKWPILELYLAERLSTRLMNEAEEMAARWDVPIVIESAEALSAKCRSAEHQGFLAKMPPFPYDNADELLRRGSACPFFVILDSLQDPYNFGAILRCADALGIDAVFVAGRNQVEVTSLVARTSAGAVNHVPLAKVPDLPALALELKQRDVQIVGASEKASQRVSDCDLCLPTAIVIGNEGAGISERLLDVCDVSVAIPQSGHVGSLNAAVSAGILFYEARRQRDAKQNLGTDD